MGRAKPESLKGLAAELDVIRELEFVREKSLCVFYFKAIPFLHFHENGDGLWADVKVDGDWSKLDLGFNPSKQVRARFLREVAKAHKKLKLR